MTGHTGAELRTSARASVLGLVYDLAERGWTACLEQEERLGDILAAEHGPMRYGWSDPAVGWQAVQWGIAAIIGHYCWLVMDRLEWWAVRDRP